MRKLWAAILRFLKHLLKRIRYYRTGAPLGIFGAPNAGKSSIANAFCRDFAGEDLSSVSATPHETRAIQHRQRLVLRDGDEELVVDVMDTPGLASRVTLSELNAIPGMSPEDAERRAKEAIQGMLDAIKALETVEGILLVVDATQDPESQVNEVILAHARARHVPVVIAANKIDLPDAKPERVEEAFGATYPVVPVSAVTHANMPALYHAMKVAFD